jgi:predicted RNA-binding protein with PUA-like domain
MMESEPDDVSIDHLARMPRQTVAWYGVRNYQARNFMRDQMQIGDPAFFYHSFSTIRAAPIRASPAS